MKYEVEYLGGHPTWKEPCKIYLSVEKNRSHIFIEKRGFWSLGENLTISKEEIVSIDLDEKSSRSIGKTAAGAVIGGVLTGGIGLLVGGAIGAAKKDKSNIYVTIKRGPLNLTVILKTGKQTQNIYAEMCGLYE